MSVSLLKPTEGQVNGRREGLPATGQTKWTDKDEQNRIRCHHQKSEYSHSKGRKRLKMGNRSLKARVGKLRLTSTLPRFWDGG